jgi:hypothetical protein
VRAAPPKERPADYAQVAIMIEGSSEPVLMSGSGIKKLVRKKKRVVGDSKDSGSAAERPAGPAPTLDTISSFYSAIHNPVKWTIERDVKLIAMANFLCESLRVTPWELLPAVCALSLVFGRIQLMTLCGVCGVVYCRI